MCGFIKTDHYPLAIVNQKYQQEAEYLQYLVIIISDDSLYNHA